MPAPIPTIVNRTPGQPAYLNGRTVRLYIDALAKPVV